jgi:hypothetical protein
MSKKSRKRNRKILAALVGGLGAAALMKGKGSSPFLASGAAGGARLPKGDAFARARRAMTTDRAYGNYHDPIMTGGVGVKPSRLPTWTGDQSMTNPDPFNYYKKGGRVKLAKRGLGRAFTKKKK